MIKLFCKLKSSNLFCAVTKMVFPLLCATVIIGLTGCSFGLAGTTSDVVLNTESSKSDQVVSLEQAESSPPSQRTQDDLIKITPPLLSDKAYETIDITWLNNQEFLVLQRGFTTDRSYRLIAYNIADASERLFFSWEAKEYRRTAVYEVDNQIKVYSDSCMYELNLNGELVNKTEFPTIDASLSSLGDYIESGVIGEEYIVNVFTGARKKLFETTDGVQYNSIAFDWSSDGQYLALVKALPVMIDTAQGEALTYKTVGVEVVDREENPVFTLPTQWGSCYVGWRADSHELVVIGYPDPGTKLLSIMIVDVDTGKELGRYAYQLTESLAFDIGKQDSVLILDIVSVDDIGLITECETYLYNYKTQQKEFFCKMSASPDEVRFSPDGRQAVILVGYEQLYLYN